MTLEDLDGESIGGDAGSIFSVFNLGTSPLQSTKALNLEPHRYVSIVMQNVNGKAAVGYQLCLPENLGDELTVIGMPGKHGTGLKCSRLRSARFAMGSLTGS